MFKKVFITVLAISLTYVSNAWPCGGEVPTYKPEAALFFTIGLAETGVMPDYYYNYFYDSPLGQYYYVPNTESDEMLDGWPRLLGLETASPAIWDDIRYLIGNASNEDLFHLMTAFEFGELEGKLQNNRAAQALVKSQNRQVLEYIIFIRALDQSGCFGGDWQDYDPDRGHVNHNDPRIAISYAGFKNTDDDELSMRYAYQHIRLLFYSGQHNAVISFFEDEIAPTPNGTFKEWCRMFYGGSLFAFDRNAEAFAAYAVVFHRSSRYSYRARESIKWVYRSYINAFEKEYWADLDYSDPDYYTKYAELYDNYNPALRKYVAEILKTELPKQMPKDELALVNSTLAYLNGDTTEGLASVLAMVAFGGEAPPDLEQFLAISIGGLGYRYFTDYDEEAAADLKDLETLIVKVADKRPDPALWYLAAAQLGIMRKDLATSQKYIDMAVKNNAPNIFPGQLLVTQILQEAWLGDLETESANQLGKLLLQLNALDNKEVYGDNNNVIHNAWVGILDTILPARYESMQRDDMAFFCLAVLNDHIEWVESEEFFNVLRSYYSYWDYNYFGKILSNPDVLANIEAIMINPQNELEKYFVAQLKSWDVNIVLELKGIAYALQHDFDAAAQTFLQMSAGYCEDDEPSGYNDVLGGALLVLNIAKHDLLMMETTFSSSYYEDCNWLKYRYAEKTDIGNMITGSAAAIFGWRWPGDDFAGFYENAATAGLTPRELAMLKRLTENPETFYDFSLKMQVLQKLSKAKDELGANAMYFYALGIFNMQDQYYLHNFKYNWPESEVAYILNCLNAAIANSNNNELKVRANFIAAGMVKNAQYTRAKLAYKTYEDFWDYSQFRPYYEALGAFTETDFGRAIMFNCPEAADFMHY